MVIKLLGKLEQDSHFQVFKLLEVIYTRSCQFELNKDVCWRQINDCCQNSGNEQRSFLGRHASWPQNSALGFEGCTPHCISKCEGSNRRVTRKPSVIHCSGRQSQPRKVQNIESRRASVSTGGV